MRSRYWTGSTDAEANAVVAAYPSLTEDEKADVDVWIAEWNYMHEDTTSVNPGDYPPVLQRLAPDFAKRHRLRLQPSGR